MRPNIELVEDVVYQYVKTPFQLTEVKKGVSTYVYQVKTEDKIMYLRIHPEEDHDYLGEVKVHELLVKNKVEVPKVLFYETNHPLLGLSFMMVEEVKGKSMDESVPKNIHEILIQAGSQLARINQLQVSGYGWINTYKDEKLIAEMKDFKEYIHANLEHDLSCLRKYDLDDELIRRTHCQIKSLSYKKEASLIHGDFDSTHIYYDNHEYRGIIDFGDIMGNHPLFDLAHLKVHDLKLYPSILQGYEKVRLLTEKDKIDLNKLAIFIATRRLGMIYGRNNTKYSQFLMKRLKEIINEL